MEGRTRHPGVACYPCYPWRTLAAGARVGAQGALALELAQDTVKSGLRPPPGLGAGGLGESPAPGRDNLAASILTSGWLAGSFFPAVLLAPVEDPAGKLSPPAEGLPGVREAPLRSDSKDMIPFTAHRLIPTHLCPTFSLYRPGSIFWHFGKSL